MLLPPHKGIKRISSRHSIPAGRKFQPGNVKPFPFGRKMGTDFLDNKLASNVALEGRWLGTAQPHSAAGRNWRISGPENPEQIVRCRGGKCFEQEPNRSRKAPKH